MVSNTWLLKSCAPREASQFAGAPTNTSAESFSDAVSKLVGDSGSAANRPKPSETVREMRVRSTGWRGRQRRTQMGRRQLRSLPHTRATRELAARPMAIPDCVNDAPAFSKICEQSCPAAKTNFDDAAHHNQWIKGLLHPSPLERHARRQRLKFTHQLDYLLAITM
jgi:hypothetical protein